MNDMSDYQESLAELELAVGSALRAIYRVEVASIEQTYAKEVAYAIPVAHLRRLSQLTDVSLPETLRKLFDQ